MQDEHVSEAFVLPAQTFLVCSREEPNNSHCCSGEKVPKGDENMKNNADIKNLQLSYIEVMNKLRLAHVKLFLSSLIT